MLKIISLFFILSITLFSQNLSTQIETVLRDSLFEVSQIAIDVYDLSSEKQLYQKNENLVLLPASNMKLFTSAAALLYLTPEEKFTTTFFYDGKIRDSVLSGNIYVKGGFDPLFSTTDLQTVADSLSALGIKQINGNLIADVTNIDSLYFGRGWMWDDNPGAYQPYLSSLCINKNSVKIYFEPGNIGELAEVNFSPESKYYSFMNSMITTNEDTSNIEIERAWLDENNLITADGDISHRKKPDSASVNIVNPPKFFLQLLKETLQKNKCKLNGESLLAKVTNEADTFATIERSLIEVINELNKESDNLSAEMIIRKISNQKFSGTASAKKGLQYLDSLVVRLGYSPKTFVFADGSGLSRYNLISASLITDLLKFIYFQKPGLYGYFFESLPIAGVDGTLEERMRFGPAYKNVHAKTGTLSGVSALSGYLTSANNHIISFSILIQNYSGSAKDARDIQDKICDILSSYK